MDEIEVSYDTLANVAGNILVELLKQHKEMVFEDEDGNPIESTPKEMAHTARNLAIICATGIDPDEAG